MERGQEPATKQDIEELRLATKQDTERVRSAIEELRSATKQDTEQLRAAIEELRSATKQDTEQLRAAIDELRSATKQDTEQLRAEFSHGFDELKEMMRDGQTELLRAFYSFAQSADAKFKDTELSDIVLRQRLTAVETRLTEIEKRINLPPAA